MSLSENLAAINLALSDAYSSGYVISRPHNLQLLEKQARQFGSKGERQVDAHIAYMVARLRPFAAHNMRTASLYLLQKYPRSSLPELASLLEVENTSEPIAMALQR